MQSVRSVRQDTAELASYLLSDKKDGRGAPFKPRPRPVSSLAARPDRTISTPELGHSEITATRPSETIDEVSEPPSPGAAEQWAAEGPSMLTTMFRKSPPDRTPFHSPKEDQVHEDGALIQDAEDNSQSLSRVSTVEPRPLLAHRDTGDDASETSPLLAARPSGSRGSYDSSDGVPGHYDVEGQKRPSSSKWLGRAADSVRGKGSRMATVLRAMSNPKHWNRHTLWQNIVVAPVACLPAVVVGLLLNILDALSYGQHHAAQSTFVGPLTWLRNDPLSPGKPDICRPRLCRDIDILRQHHHLTGDILPGEHIQGRCWLRVGESAGQQAQDT